MITQLTINNFAIVDQLLVDFTTGMTAITGETGAGKSIAIDALGLCLGNRSDASAIRNGADRVDISASFVLDDTPAAYSWLTENQLDEGNECILRRVINQDGRSKAFINGRAVPISQLKDLGQMLIQIHGQHEHQRLLRSDYQQILLNHYMNEPTLLSNMQQAYKQWKSASQAYQQYLSSKQERDAHVQLLQYQLKELNEFSPIEGEYQQIDEEYKKLSNSEQLINLSQQSIMLLDEADEYNVSNMLNSVKQSIHELVALDPSLNDVLAMLEDAAIQIKEASYELRHYSESLELDPARVMQLEQRLSKQIALARKHHVSPEALPELHQNLLNEFKQINQQDEQGEQLKEEIKKYQQIAIELAAKLHQKRLTVSKTLAKKVMAIMHDLSMPNGQFSIDVIFDENRLGEDGADQVSFLVSTNAGQVVQPLAKVASGGELSRIALAIQVLTAQKMDTPALIFDEIDVGISGPTAAKVGQLLRQLGESTQVITVTHLPQVAGQANQHYFVSKQTNGKQTSTDMQRLDENGRLNELARLLGGDKITDATLANAKELLII
ncbi:DNA repair protein RecN [Gilliamella sp. B2865]|uniref:DNA repair protein RecN n=1 Tax=unclassified Gilliamella TaxID=2685620 RepID=UPI00226A8297|nr:MULTISPECIES: DNA repair protein RecN [unclassified Gilliamella]MCX8586170.1 DNA repair protein RecN [Gilliamella sp. B3562]MCX8671514.1 DNA repair protein RecN [Gilliamella sp. B2785]MCX8673789.1 DNA repair protein RecN [Gilliamella sp. B3023]MCX8679089.1 DNA repair protein RecN [Gilliamella sp. B2865]MCX8685873.1 DNA repair protein RecN [Gilliamella sp. B2864]